MSMPLPVRQRGAALILFFTVMVIAATTIVLGALNNRSPQVQDRINKQIEMAKIKESLLGYALSYANYNNTNAGPGRLPCPDTTNDGQMNCSGIITVGRLPQSLTTTSSGPVFLSDRYVGVDQQFWYAVATAFRQDTTSLNSTHNLAANLLSVDGALGEYAALIIAPGPALDSQVRNAGVQINGYLEAATDTTATSFISRHPSDSTLFNDSIIGITGDEVMTYATLQAALEFKRLMLIYLALPLVANVLPADLALLQTALATLGTPSWFINDSWASALESYTPSALSSTDIKFQNCDIVYTFDFSNNTVSRAPSSC